MINKDIRRALKVFLNRTEEAVHYGEKGCSCSEAVLAAYSRPLGLDRDLAIRIASGFGGGMGLRGDTCGAVTAAYMVLGLMFGTSDLTDGYKRQKTYLMVDEFAERFIERQGALNCRELCPGHDMSTPEGAQTLREGGRPQLMIRTAMEILQDLIREVWELGDSRP